MSLVAEASALGAALASPRTADLVVDLLTADDFQRPAHATLFEAIRALRSEGKAADLVTVTDHLALAGRLDEVGGPARLYEMQSGAPSGEVEAWCSVVRATARRTHVTATLDRLKSSIATSEDVDQVVEDAVAGLLAGRAGGPTVDRKMLLEDFYTRLDSGSPLAGWRMPYPALDFFRLPDDGLTVWTGLPGSGKSTLLDALVVEWLQRHGDMRVAFFSPEQGPADNHLFELVRTKLGGEPRQDQAGAAEAAEWIAQRCDWIDDDRDNTPSAVLAAARRLVRDGVRLLVIDPYNNLEPDSSVKGDRQDLYIQALLRRLRRFARTTGCAVVVVAHPRRTEKVLGTDAVYRIPTAGDISGGQEWWNHSDCIVTVWRNQSGERPEEFGGPSLVKVVVSKCRFAKWGTPGKGELTFLGQDVRRYR